MRDEAWIHSWAHRHGYTAAGVDLPPGPTGLQPGLSLSPCTWPAGGKQNGRGSAGEQRNQTPTRGGKCSIRTYEAGGPTGKRGISLKPRGTLSLQMTQLWRCGGPHPEPDTPCHKPAGAWIPHTGTPEPGSSPVPTPAELDPPHKRTSELPRGSGTSPQQTRPLLTSASFFLAIAPAPTPRRCIPAAPPRVARLLTSSTRDARRDATRK